MSPRASETHGLEGWVYSASRVSLAVVSALFGLALFGLSCGLDVLWAKYNGATIVAMVSADVLVATIAALLLFTLLLARRASYRRLMRRLEIIAEMNHHIRNALETIQLTSYSSSDKQQLSRVLSAAERINWALRELLPKTTETSSE